MIEMKLPGIIGATRGLNTHRYPKLPDILKAKKKEIKQIAIGELGLALSSPQTEIVPLEAVAEGGAGQDDGRLDTGDG